MFTQSPFYYKVSIHQGAQVTETVAEMVQTLPLGNDPMVVLLVPNNGKYVQGLYVNIDGNWALAIPYEEISFAAIRGDTLAIWAQPAQAEIAPATAELFHNGVRYTTDLNIRAGDAVWAARIPPAGGSGSGAVDSVNGQTGNVQINAANLPGLPPAAKSGSYNDLTDKPALSAVATSGSYTDLTNKPALAPVATSGSYTDLTNKPAPVPATTTTLGSVIVGDGLAIAADGTISADAQALTPATATVLGGVKVGSGLTVQPDGTLSANTQTIPAASATVLGGVTVAASSAVAVNGAGALDLSTATKNSIASKVSDVGSSGTGTSLVFATGPAAKLKSITAAGNLSLNDDGAGNLTLTASPTTLVPATTTTLGGVIVGTGLTVQANGTLAATPYTLTAATASALGGVKVGSGLTVAGDGTLSANAQALTPATATVLGGVKVGSGLAVTADGTLSATATQYVLPVSTATVLGGVKVGSGLTVAGDGTLSANATPIATTTVAGVVKAGSGLNVAGDGTLSTVALAPATATVLGGVKVGSGLAVTADGTLSATATAGVTSVNSKTGAVTITGSGGVTVDNSGANVALDLTLTNALIVAGLGYTPYNATNPNNYLTANQNITVTGDATGSGTNAITLTLANSGVAAGTYKSVTVDAKGRVTAGTNPTTLAGYGITDALNSVSGGSVGGTITMTGGAKLTGLPAPTVGGDATNKDYVDTQISAVVSGTSWHQNAQVATTASITLSGLQTIDGYTTVAGDRVLVKNQTDQTQNGIYVAAAGAWTRSTDADTGAEIKGMALLVLNGATSALSQWVNTNATNPVIGTDNITYTRLAGNGTVYSAGTGLTLSGTTFSITNTGVTAGTYQSVTVNAQGQVTAGAALSSGNVTTALGFTPYNATNPNNYISANQNITVTGDATGSGTTAITLALAASGVTAGTYKSVTVDAKGRVTAGTNPTTLAGYGITDALSTSGGSLTGTITLSGAGLITGLPATTVSAGDATSKAYVNAQDTALVNNDPWKQVVAAASTVNIGAAGGLVVVDGYQTVAGDRILVKDQTDTTSNGIWIAASGVWTRASDSTTDTQIRNQVVLVLNGATQARTQWMNTNTSAITVNTTPISYARTATGTTYTGGTGITVAGTVISLANTAVTPGTFTKVTVDAQGRVTAGAALASSDVTAALGFTPIAGNQAITLSGDATGTGTTAITVALANSGVTAGTFTKVTVDAKGRVTVGANLSASDVTTALTYTPVNRAGDTMAGALNLAPIANVNSGATTNIAAATTNSVNILGSATISNFDTGTNGMTRTLIFQGAATLVHSAGNLILPTAANIVAAIGDVAEFICLTVNNWQCLNYTRASGLALAGSPDNTKLPLAGGTMSGALNEAPVVTVASAATTNIGAANANTLNITGNAAITAFDTVASGITRKLVFAASGAVLTNSAALVTPTNANITVVAGDTAEVLSLGGGNWKILYYTRFAVPFATLSGIEILTNKTLVNPTITNFTESGAAVSSAAYTVDLTNGTDFEITTTANLAVTLPTPVAGKSYTVTIVYGGAHTVTFAGGGTIAYAGNVAPTATSVTGKTDIYVMKCNRAGTKTFVADGGRNF